MVRETVPSPLGPPPAQSPLQAAGRIAPLASSLAERTERERELAPELLGELAAGGLMRMCLPRSIGGPECAPAEMVLALEELSRGDGAVGWCAMIASTSSLLGGYLEPGVAARIYGDPASVMGGVFAPRGRAEPRAGGYLLSGRWPFASGVQHSDWLLGGAVVDAPHGGQAPGEGGGAPEARLMVMPAASIQIIDTWSVSGLRGTGSHDMAVSDELVPAERTVSLSTEAPRHPGPLYCFPLFGLLSVGIAAVSLGIARGAIEDIIRLAGARTPSGSSRPMAQRSTVQVEVARAEAMLRAARALVLEEAASAWAAATETGRISTEGRLGLRLAATHATQTAAEVATAMYRAGGGSSIYETSPLQRRFRDANVATQHMMVAPATFELTGRLLLGVPTDTSQL